MSNKMTIDNLRGKAQGVTQAPAGVAKPAPKKPSNKITHTKNTNPAPVAKPAPKVAKAKVKDPVAMVTPYGLQHPAFTK